jgi:AraC-like DNA-binding protein
MPALSLTAPERARKAHARVLQALQEPGTARTLAQVMGVSEATISRTKTEKLEDALALLYQLGFKVVEQDRHCVPADYLQALQVMAREHMRSGAVTLQWDEG